MKNRIAAILLFYMLNLVALPLYSQTRSLPNIIIILADDMGWGDASVYPQEKHRKGVSLTTPNIDRMAANGVQCMSGYSTGQVCSPSRAGILTGRYQQSFGYYGFPETLVGIPKEVPTIAEQLRTKGYVSALFGKEHAGTKIENGPLARGFDSFFGFLAGEHDYFDARTGEAIMALSNEKDAFLWDQDRQIKDSNITYLTDQITDRSVAFIRKQHKNRQPFFLYIPYNAPHPPLQAKWEKLKTFFPHFKEKGYTSRDLARAMLLSLDEGVGQILDVLEELKIEENTLLFFSSDNGGHDDGTGGELVQHNGGLKSRKGFFWEGGIRVPYIVQWKGSLPAGLKYERPVNHLDITATALTVAGIRNENLHGVNLIPFFTGQVKGDPHEVLYWGMEESESKWAVRMGDWKLICEQEHPGPVTDPSKRVTALFNLASDRNETTNLINEYPDIVRQLSDHKNAFYRNSKPSIATEELLRDWKIERERRLKINGGRQRPRLDGYPEIWQQINSK